MALSSKYIENPSTSPNFHYSTLVPYHTLSLIAWIPPVASVLSLLFAFLQLTYSRTCHVSFVNTTTNGIIPFTVLSSELSPLERTWGRRNGLLTLQDLVSYFSPPLTPLPCLYGLCLETCTVAGVYPDPTRQICTLSIDLSIICLWNALLLFSFSCLLPM